MSGSRDSQTYQSRQTTLSEMSQSTISFSILTRFGKIRKSEFYSATKLREVKIFLRIIGITSGRLLVTAVCPRLKTNDTYFLHRSRCIGRQNHDGWSGHSSGCTNDQTSYKPQTFAACPQSRGREFSIIKSCQIVHKSSLLLHSGDNNRVVCTQLSL